MTDKKRTAGASVKTDASRRPDRPDRPDCSDRSDRPDCSDRSDRPDVLTLSEAQARFARIAVTSMRVPHTQGEAGIGTLAEKRLHAIVKRFLCEDEDFHEVGVPDTRYVSDVRLGDDIFEVQTGSFYPLLPKLRYYLEHTDCTVTVVHPIAAVKWVSWVEPDTGEVVSRRRAPRAGTVAELLPELDALTPLLGHPRLRFRLLLLEIQDFRLLNGYSADRKRGAKKYDSVPLSLVDDRIYAGREDFRELIPDTLPAHFTAKDFARATRLRGRKAYFGLRAAKTLSLIAEAEPIGRSHGYRKEEE